MTCGSTTKRTKARWSRRRSAGSATSWSRTVQRPGGSRRQPAAEHPSPLSHAVDRSTRARGRAVATWGCCRRTCSSRSTRASPSLPAPERASARSVRATAGTSGSSSRYSRDPAQFRRSELVAAHHARRSGEHEGVAGVACGTHPSCQNPVRAGVRARESLGPSWRDARFAVRRAALRRVRADDVWGCPTDC